MKKITTIIVTYNSEHHIYDCLESLFKYNDIGDELEVIIVDNCSRNFNEMKARLKEKYAENVTVIPNTRNGGYGQGNNVGIKASHAPIIMIMNPDVRLCEPIFRKVTNVFEESSIIMYGATQRHKDGSLGRSTAWTSLLHPYIAEPMRFVFGFLNIYWQKYMYICGACFFVRKISFEKVGLFDETIFMYNEEDDIHRRLLKIKDSKIFYDRHHSYLHLHPRVMDYKTEKYDWLNKSLESLIYLNKRDGISRKKTIQWAIKRTNISVWSEKLKLFLGRGNKDRLEYFKHWRSMQKELLNS